MSGEQPSALPPWPPRERPVCPTCGAYGLILLWPSPGVPRWIVADPEEMPEIDRLRHERDEARAVLRELLDAAVYRPHTPPASPDTVYDVVADVALRVRAVEVAKMERGKD